MPVVIPETLLSLLHTAGTTARYAPKAPIFIQGELASDFYIIAGGRVRVFTVTADGHERTLEILGVGRVFGESSFLSNACRTVNIEAVTESEIIKYTAQELLALCTKSEALLRLLFQHMADTCNYLTAQLVQASDYDSTQKVAAFLLRESANRQQRVLPYSHEELAASVGLNRVTVSRVIANLKKQQLVRVTYRAIELCDAAGLSRLLPEKGTY
ncbi:MAG: Crp/Fnr family transcriptional regulator [Oscillospiraceae bacterium]|nr:Crp/Fnr family transcriptional regulator [Oscillospiraceae bacterium]